MLQTSKDGQNGDFLPTMFQLTSSFTPLIPSLENRLAATLKPFDKKNLF